MIDTKKNFNVSVQVLDSRLEEQSALTALFAAVGAIAMVDASAFSSDDISAPSCTIFSW